MKEYIVYEFDGKKIRIPKDEIQQNLKIPQVKDEDDAIWIWLEDNGYIDNDEQNALDKKAKDNKITQTIHQAKASEKKERKKVERKPDLDKEHLITLLAEMLTDNCDNVKITNVSKLIEFDLKDEHYKLDLVKQRKPKK